MSEQIEEKRKKLESLAKGFVKANIHYGHKAKEWNPKMAPYISQEKDGYHYIDLLKSCKLLKVASNFLQARAQESAKFLF